MANVIKVPAKTETKIVEIEPEKYVLEMTKREALIVQTLLANTRDTDSNFPEVYELFKALRDSGLDYYSKFTIDRTHRPGSATVLVEIGKPKRTGTDEEW